MLKKTGICFLVIISCCFTCFGCDKQNRKPLLDMDYSQSTWLWDATLIGSIQMIDNLSELDINEVYVNTGWDDTNKEYYLESHPIKYNVFIDEATNKNINVQALLSNNDWALDKYYNDFEKQVKTILDYNKKYTNRFSAIHLDVEPYLLSGWDTNKELYLSSYINNLQKIKVLIEKHNAEQQDNLKLAIDIPFWFYQEKFIIKANNTVDLILGTVDEINIMDYTKNQANFEDWGDNILAIAEEHHNKIVKIAFELKPDVAESLYPMTPEEITNYVNESCSEFTNYSSFDGMAVHDYEAYISYVDKNGIE